MAVNYFDQPAEMPIMNTYVPIDFGNLYRIGVTQKEAVQQAQEDLSNYLQTYSDFTSPSQVDTDNWYRLTLNRPEVQSLLDRAAADPDQMKDPGFLSEVQSVINSTNYAALGRLRSSRDNLLMRIENVNKLMQQDRYNPMIHDLDYSNYDTLGSGKIFEDISPLPYTSVVDMVKPYVDNLKPEFIGTSGGWIQRGVTEDRTDAQVRANWSNITSTPAYQQNLEITKMMYPGISDQDATDLLNAQIFTAGREFAVVDQERDPWWMQSQRLQMQAGLDPSNRMKNLTTLIHEDSKRMFRTNYSGLSGQDLEAYINFGEEALSPDARKIVEENTKPINIINRNREAVAGIVANNGGNFYEATKYITRYNEFALSDLAANIFTKSQTSGTQLKGGGYRTASLQGFIPEDELGANMSGFSFRDENIQQTMKPELAEAYTRKMNMWSGDNKIDDVIVQPKGLGVSNNAKAYNKAWAYIPYDKAMQYMGNEANVIMSGGSVVTLTPEQTESVSTSVRTDDEGKVQSRTTSRSSKAQTYVRYDVVSPISSWGERAMTSDAQYIKGLSLSTDTRDTQSAQSQLERASEWDWIPRTNNNE